MPPKSNVIPSKSGKQTRFEDKVNTQHIYHHSDGDGIRIHLSVEKNTKAYNWKASVEGAKTVQEAMAIVKDAEAQLRAEYGESQEA